MKGPKSSFWVKFIPTSMVIASNLLNQSVTNRQDDYYNPLAHVR